MGLQRRGIRSISHSDDFKSISVCVKVLGWSAAIKRPEFEPNALVATSDIIYCLSDDVLRISGPLAATRMVIAASAYAGTMLPANSRALLCCSRFISQTFHSNEDCFCLVEDPEEYTVWLRKARAKRLHSYQGMGIPVGRLCFER